MPKANKLLIVGNSYITVTQVAALIRSFKIPEPYKGKGIVYTTEKIILKEKNNLFEILNYIDKNYFLILKHIMINIIIYFYQKHLF